MRSAKPQRLAFAPIAAVIALVASSAAARRESLTFQVEPQTENCLFSTLKAGDQVSANLMVVKGGKLDVRLKIDSPGSGRVFEKLIYSNVDDKTGNIVSTVLKKGHKFVAPSNGNHAFCFDNTMSRWTAKVVFFELEVTAARADQEGPEEVGFMGQSARRIYDALDETESHQRFLQQREHRHRNTAESTNERIAWYTVAETAVIVGLSVAQVVLVRRWFTASTGLPGGMR